MGALESYDDVPYPTRAQAPVHPDRLAVAALLFGLDPPALTACRVLEIGCGDGANLIPIAAVLPGSRCEGVDASASAVARGRDFAEQAGLRNLTLRCARIEEPGAVEGEFDYILCHGVYSWVPDAVRDAVLAVCDWHLSRQGLAVVSYNTKPGGFARQAVREMLRWHVRDLPEPAERIAEARALARLLEERMLEDSEHTRALRAELRVVRGKEDGHFFHNDLADINELFSFQEFATHASRHHLRYVTDADLTDLARPALPEDLRQLIRALSDDRVEREQYMDFLVARRFRQTILCHAEQAVADAPTAARLTQCWFSSPASNTTPAKVTEPGAVATFEKPGGPRLQTDFLPGKLAMRALVEAWPRRLAFAELEGRVRGVMEREAGASAWTDKIHEALPAFLLEAIAARLVHGHAFAPHTATVPGERPCAFPPARLQATTGEIVVTAFHQMLRLEHPAARALVGRLDGTRSRGELLQFMRARAASLLADQHDGWPRTEAELGELLGKLAEHGLLVG